MLGCLRVLRITSVAMHLHDAIRNRLFDVFGISVSVVHFRESGVESLALAIISGPGAIMDCRKTSCMSLMSYSGVYHVVACLWTDGEDAQRPNCKQSKKPQADAVHASPMTDNHCARALGGPSATHNMEYCLPLKLVLVSVVRAFKS